MAEQTIPGEVQQLLDQGHRAYRSGDVREAQRLDEQALRRAEALGSSEGVTRATRFLGLCAYRLGESTRSEALLQGARRLARGLDWEHEELLCCNHLGATLRKLGKLEEADQTFRDALRRAGARVHLDARARLSGSYGAFLDDLGEKAAAAEHYARSEELLGLLDAPARLANAHGLVSRAARLRGDAETALAKAELERDLGVRLGDPLREGRGWMHAAQAEAALGNAARAEAAFRGAVISIRRSGDVRAPIEVAVAFGRFLREKGRIPEAYEQLQRAQAALEGGIGDEREHTAKVAELAAEVAGDAGLHGEALWYLRRAIGHHLERFEPISNPSLKERTREKRRRLVDLAARLGREAGEVEREADERAVIDELVRRLDPERESRPAAEAFPLGEWRRRVRQQAQLRWERLLPGTYGLLSLESQTDLVLSDLVFQGPVDDLGRSLHLIFASIERELRRVVGVRLRARNGDPPTLRPLVNALRPASTGPRSSELQALVDSLVGEGHPLSALDALLETAQRVDGSATKTLISLRNDIAHGNLLALTRLDVDAVRRVLVLGRDAVLPMIAKLPKAEHPGPR